MIRLESITLNPLPILTVFSCLFTSIFLLFFATFSIVFRALDPNFYPSLQLLPQAVFLLGIFIVSSLFSCLVWVNVESIQGHRIQMPVVDLQAI